MKTRMLAAAVVTALLPIGVATSAEVYPGVSIGLSHTDNLRLSPTDEEDETIYRIEPTLVVAHDSERVALDIDYQMQALYYEGLSEDQVFHSYDADLRLSAIPDSLFLDVGGRRSQTIVDPTEPVPIGNLPLVRNRQDRDEYWVQPGFAFPIGSDVVAQGHFRQGWVENSGGRRGAELRDGMFDLNNFERGSGLTWALRYVWRRALGDDADPFENQRATAELGYWVSPNARIFASGGRESDFEQPFDPSMEASIWEAGFAYRSGERFSAEFAAGERSFGSTLRGDLIFQFRRGSMSFSYVQDPTSQAFNRFRQGSVGGNPLTLDDLLGNPGVFDVFVNERLEWQLDLEGRRAGFGLTVFDVRRTDQVDENGTPIEDSQQTGVNARFSYQVGSKTTLRLNGGMVNREQRDRIDSDLTRASFVVDYRLGQRTGLSLRYAYAEEDGEVAGGFREYRSNTVTLLFTWSAEPTNPSQP